MSLHYTTVYLFHSRPRSHKTELKVCHAPCDARLSLFLCLLTFCLRNRRFLLWFSVFMWASSFSHKNNFFDQEPLLVCVWKRKKKALSYKSTCQHMWLKSKLNFHHILTIDILLEFWKDFSWNPLMKIPMSFARFSRSWSIKILWCSFDQMPFLECKPKNTL